MSYLHPAWVEHQRKRWLRPDWQHWVRHDAHRFLPPRWQPIPQLDPTNTIKSRQWAGEVDEQVSGEELARLRWLVKDLRIDLALRRLKRKYRPDQARDEQGRWVDEDRTDAGSADAAAATVSVSVEPENPATERADEGAPPLVFVGNRTAVTIDYSNALTGFPDIDKNTKALSEVLADTMVKMDFIPEWTPQVYGTAVHVAFGASVRVAGLNGIGPLDVEQSFIGGDTADYGDAGSIRTDVAMRNVQGDVVAIYDVKTGNADMSAARARQIRANAGVGLDVPIIQLHALRGASFKSRVAIRKIGVVLARLVNT